MGLRVSAMHVLLWASMAGGPVTARERLVRVVAEANRGHRPILNEDKDIYSCWCGMRFGVQYPENGSWRDHQAEAVVAAMEAEMGLRIEHISQLRLGDGVFHPATAHPPGDRLGNRRLK